MPIIAKGNGGDFVPAPEGLWPALCVDVVDKGMVESAMYKPRHMIQIRWVLDAEPALPTGKPHMAVRSFGLTLGEKSNLKPFLEAWRGKKFTEDEIQGFDVEKLIGANCQLQIIHNKKNGNVYANVQAVVPQARGAVKMTAPADYVRQADRPDAATPFQDEPKGNAFPDEPEAHYEAVDEDLPF